MATWGVEARIKYRAWDTSTNAGVAGDSANHTLTLRRAGTDSSFVGAVNDLGGGVYEAVVSGTLAETYEFAMRGASSTADVVLFFESPVRTVKAAPTLTEISDQITADHGEGSYVDTGPGLDAVGVRTAVGLTSANLATIIGAIPTTEPLDSAATEAAALAAIQEFGPAKPGAEMSLTNAVVQLISEYVQIGIIDEDDSHLVLNAIVGAIGNANVDEVALVAAIRADIERGSGPLISLLDRLTSARAGYLDKLGITGTLAHTGNASLFQADTSGLLTAAAFNSALPAGFSGLSIDAETGGIIASNMVGAAPTAGEIETVVGSALTNYQAATKTDLGSITIDADGLEINALTEDQARWIQETHEKAMLLGMAGVVVRDISPVDITGRVILYLGFDYVESASGKVAIPADSSRVPGEGETVHFQASKNQCKAGEETPRIEVEGEVATIDGETVCQFEFPAETWAAVENPAGEWTYFLLDRSEEGLVTGFATGRLTVRKGVE